MNEVLQSNLLNTCLTFVELEAIKHAFNGGATSLEPSFDSKGTPILSDTYGSIERKESGLIQMKSEIRQLREMPFSYWEELVQSEYDEKLESWRSTLDEMGVEKILMMKHEKAVLANILDKISERRDNLSKRASYTLSRRVDEIDTLLTPPVKQEADSRRRRQIGSRIFMYRNARNHEEKYRPDAIQTWMSDFHSLFNEALLETTLENLAEQVE